MTNAVIVSDMLVGSLEPDHKLYCGYDARGIIPNVQMLLERELAEGSKVFYICDSHAPDNPEFELFPVHCVEGTDESNVIPELATYEGTIVPKTHYSGFFGTDLEQRLVDLAPRKVIICGVCTDICVMYTTADARNRDYLVEVPVNCVATFDKQANDYALHHMDKILGATLV